MGKAMRASGYSDSYSLNPHRVKKTKGYNKLMIQEVDKLRHLRDKAIEALAGKDPSMEEYRTLVEAVEKYTKLIQLLEGKPTEITAETTRQMTDAEIEAEIQKLENGETEPEGAPSAGEAEEGISEEEAN
jgi:hypothetical protein